MGKTLANIDVGAAPGDGTGDPARTAFQTVNSNFDETETGFYADVSGEIAALTQKSAPTGSDHLMMEDAAAANAKKRTLIANIFAQFPVAYRGHNQQTGTTYTLVLTDAGLIVEMNNASANTLTIPANASVAFPIDTRIDVFQYGAGQTTIAITSDTLRGLTKIGAQYGMVSLWKRAATEWVVIGGVA